VSASEIALSLRARVTGRVTDNAPLSGFTTFRVGGPADVLVEAESVDDLRAVADLREDLPLAIVGRGSNLLVSDDGFRGIAVRLGRAFRSHEPVADTVLNLGGAVHLPAAARLTARLGLTGFEFAAEIPATFGGAVRMNAGAHDGSMAGVLVDAELVNLRTGDIRTIDVADLDYSYRSSNLDADEIVTGGSIRLSPADPRDVAARIANYLHWRRENQPAGRSAGSVFKNPTGASAGRLIDQAGAKGMRVGGAEISSVHANFIVASSDARADDVWGLIWSVHTLVRERTGIDLEPEVRFLGNFPDRRAQRTGNA
jgi:UDP-N-acetylmuramate dehydrogenase